MNMTLGKYLQMLLLKKEWNAFKLSEESRIHHNTVGYLLADRDKRSGKPVDPRYSTLKSLSSALRVPVENLVIALDGRDPGLVRPSQPTETAHQVFQAGYDAAVEEMKRKVLGVMGDG
jgi:transcriptional regulator with XRE-family HTH domain